MTARIPLLTALALLALLALASQASAHARGRSFSRIDLAPDGARIELRITAFDLTRIPPERAPQGRAAHLAEKLRIEAGSGPCEPLAMPREGVAGEGTRRFVWFVRCPGAPERLESRVLAELAPSHLHFARIALPSGAVTEALLAEGRRSARLAEGGAEVGGFAAFVALGARHIASGVDHLVFVAALLLLALSFGELVGLVSAFTLAHSVTLALAVLGHIRPEPGAVEALIGFSIALVALENVWLLSRRGRAVPALAVAALALGLGLAALGLGAIAPLTWAGLALFTGCHFALLARVFRPARLRAALAFAFGLVHGLGFAGVLAELELPRARLAPALLGFNLGVELGQLAFVALLWPLLRALAARAPAWHRLGAEVASAGIAGLGVFWLVVRAYA